MVIEGGQDSSKNQKRFEKMPIHFRSSLLLPIIHMNSTSIPNAHIDIINPTKCAVNRGLACSINDRINILSHIHLGPKIFSSSSSYFL